MLAARLRWHVKEWKSLEIQERFLLWRFCDAGPFAAARAADLCVACWGILGILAKAPLLRSPVNLSAARPVKLPNLGWQITQFTTPALYLYLVLRTAHRVIGSSSSTRTSHLITSRCMLPIPPFYGLFTCPALLYVLLAPAPSGPFCQPSRNELDLGSSTSRAQRLQSSTPSRDSTICGSARGTSTLRRISLANQTSLLLVLKGGMLLLRMSPSKDQNISGCSI